MYLIDCSYNKHSGYLTHTPDHSEVAAKAQWARDYYEALYPGTVRIKVLVQCDKCEGAGRVAKGRKGVRFPKYVECPCCHGKASFPVPFVG